MTQFFLLVYLILLEIRTCYGLILLILKKNEKSIKIDKVMPGNMGLLFCETPCIYNTILCVSEIILHQSGDYSDNWLSTFLFLNDLNIWFIMMITYLIPKATHLQRQLCSNPITIRCQKYGERRQVHSAPTKPCMEYQMIPLHSIPNVHARNKRKCYLFSP